MPIVIFQLLLTAVFTTFLLGAPVANGLTMQPCSKNFLFWTIQENMFSSAFFFFFFASHAGQPLSNNSREVDYLLRLQIHRRKWWWQLGKKLEGLPMRSVGCILGIGDGPYFILCSGSWFFYLFTWCHGKIRILIFKHWNVMRTFSRMRLKVGKNTVFCLFVFML